MIPRTLRFILLLGLTAGVIYLKYNPGSTPSETPSSSVSVQPSDVFGAGQGIPQKALRVLQIVRSTGQPPPGYVGGTIFQNREGRLPEGGSYREFDVDPHYGQRNAERIIVEWNTKQAWYTGDHYQTFTPLP
jgi:guanyl-specific ribonuclease Sa